MPKSEKSVKSVKSVKSRKSVKSVKSGKHRPVKHRDEILWLLVRNPRLAAELSKANIRLDAKGKILAVPFIGCPFQGAAPCPMKKTKHEDLVSVTNAAFKAAPKPTK